MLLIHATVESSVPGHVIQFICKGAQLCQFNMLTHLQNWSHLDVQEVTHFLWAWINCPGLLNNGVILLHDDV
jgi:hypothetical protein